jgi:hypothetical protein
VVITTLRVKMTLRVKITVVHVEITLCVLKSHSACKNHTRASVMKIERVLAKIFLKIDTQKCHFHTFAYLIFSTRPPTEFENKNN